MLFKIELDYYYRQPETKEIVCKNGVFVVMVNKEKKMIITEGAL